MISHRHRAIFIHIQKTGGDAISTALGASRKEPNKHWSAREVRAACDPAVWAGYFKFAFVRNPWARLVSWYAMIDGLRPRFEAGAELNRFHTAVLSRAGNFSEFLRNMDEEVVDADGRKLVLREQIDYLIDDDGALIVDYVGRFETLARDFESILPRLHGTPAPLQQINVGRHRPYAEYYSPADAEFVARRFARDIARFGYRFGDD